MNLYSATVETFRRFAVRGAPRVIEKRTYVFLLVPFDISCNGHAQRADVVQPFIDMKAETLRAPKESATPILGDGMTAATEFDEPQLNYELAWTWFLPNPLWPPKRSE